MRFYFVMILHSTVLTFSRIFFLFSFKLFYSFIFFQVLNRHVTDEKDPKSLSASVSHKNESRSCADPATFFTYIFSF